MNSNKGKKAYWSENILLKLYKPKKIPKDTGLIVRCWDNRVKGRDGILTEIKANLVKFNPYENKGITIILFWGKQVYCNC